MRLILLERSEPALYAIEQELRALCPDGMVLKPVLGSATDPLLLQHLFSDQAVELVFHAAAYKHVPLVEANPLVGLANNVGSTDQVCRAAVASGVRQVVLISTDKAVRPTNVMGRPRPAELVVQAHAAEASTCFSMVRFAMCSVPQARWCPCFAARSLLAADNPHPPGDHPLLHDHPRGGHVGAAVFRARPRWRRNLLDMGEPVRIKALAEQMVRWSGLSLRDAAHPDGDIEIVCTGLRPGEKLYEELTDAESQPTAHPLIIGLKNGRYPP